MSPHRFSLLYIKQQRYRHICFAHLLWEPCEAKNGAFCLSESYKTRPGKTTVSSDSLNDIFQFYETSREHFCFDGNLSTNQNKILRTDEEGSQKPSNLHFLSKIFRPPLWSSDQSSWLQVQRSGFDSQRYQIFWEAVGLERGPLSLVSATEELLGRKSSCSSLESQEFGRIGSAELTTWHRPIRANFADKRLSLGLYSSLRPQIFFQRY
jgi:hypothetical protein